MKKTKTECVQAACLLMANNDVLCIMTMMMVIDDGDDVFFRTEGYTSAG